MGGPSDLSAGRAAEAPTVKTKCKWEIIIQRAAFHPESPWLGILWFVPEECAACKQRKRARGRKREEEGAGDVLIKGNSEGLDQIILHNLVREDTRLILRRWN